MSSFIIAGMENLVRSLEALRNKYHDLEEEHRDLQKKNEELASLVKWYEERFRLSQHRQYGQSSEKSEGQGLQLLLFDEAENTSEPKRAEPEVEEITYRRRKRDSSSVSRDNFDELPVERVECTIPEEERICPECGGPMHVMNCNTRRELVVVPAKVFIREYARDIYSCRRCERENTKVGIVKAPIPEPVIKGSAASASAIANIMIQKYAMGVPLYRQESSWLNEGLSLSRQTMSNWLIKSASDWLLPLYEEMRTKMLKEDILHADETTVQVLKEPGRASRTNSYMWLYRTGKEASVQIVLFEYQETRSSVHPKKFLSGFKGCLHTDGYSGYGKLDSAIRRCGCWAHARRKFHEGTISIPAVERKNSLSQTGLEYCDKLFALEREYEKLTPEERHAKRLQKSKPVTDAFFAWAASARALPQSTLGKALHYALEQRIFLETFYMDGRIEISNNRAERSIKPFVIGRKNWLFCCSSKGAKSSSVIYSIIETAKENNLKLFEYLNHILETMPNIKPEQYHTLLPWSENLPETCRLKKSTDRS